MKHPQSHEDNVKDMRLGLSVKGSQSGLAAAYGPSHTVDTHIILDVGVVSPLPS